MPQAQLPEQAAAIFQEILVFGQFQLDRGLDIKEVVRLKTAELGRRFTGQGLSEHLPVAEENLELALRRYRSKR